MQPPDPPLQRSATRFSLLPQKILDLPLVHIMMYIYVSKPYHTVTNLLQVYRKYVITHLAANIRISSQIRKDFSPTTTKSGSVIHQELQKNTYLHTSRTCANLFVLIAVT